jgi:low temperature requirement protein LtrA
MYLTLEQATDGPHAHATNAAYDSQVPTAPLERPRGEAPDEVPEPTLDEADEQRVTSLELFFDLVFVFGITQVTTLMAADPTGRGVTRGLLALGALWWAWAAYAWLTNEIDPEEGGVRLVIFTAMAAMLVTALATPRAFADDGVTFACAYLVVRALHLILYASATDDVGVKEAVVRLAPTSLIGSVLLILAGVIGDWTREPLWGLALLIDYGGPFVSGVAGWRISPGHFAERHGLIILIALGESVVAVGAASGRPLDAGTITAAALGIVLVCSLWWAYFDVVAPVAERKLRSLHGEEQNRMARDSYSYLHFAMVAGIVLTALGIKKTLADVTTPLHAVPAVALCGGIALYLAALVLFRLRNLRTWNRQRALATLVCLALIPLATSTRALLALGAVAAVLAVLIAYEATRFAEARRRIRHAGVSRR